ncbi:response regulator [Paenibacillus psychroresistens]|uniref:Response regulator n=1 Tax=Paenibacillus psychroresistens TaxID=1778678 RepID=A0A6B8RWG0_9BACL|nr:response regulator [Paenibacillus psychroresistens]QGQ99723.1 response regulator [Paenibacillus psychroresistens]
MKVVIIDDEKAMHLIMRRMLAKVVDIDIVGFFQETASAFSYLENHETDLVFVDISMPRENGLEFARRLRATGRQTRLIFVTSHKEHALSAFDVYAFDYILKPVEKARLQQTLQRALAEKKLEQMQTELEPASNGVTYICLGGIDILTAEGISIKWKSTKSAELFGYLLMNKGRRVSRARLIEDIFGDLPQKNAESYLNTTVYQLRKLLEAFGLRGNLYSDTSHYVLDFHNVRVDFYEFEEGCKRMAVIDETNIKQAIELEQIYGGDLFGDRAFHWARSEVERLSLIYTAFAQQLCSTLLSRGETHASIRLLKKLITQNELDEETIMSLMKALAKLKNKEAVIQQYIQFTETLHNEIGIGPSIGVTDLYQELLSELD